MEEPIWINDQSVQVDVNDSESTTNLSKMMKLTEEGLPPTAKTNFDGTNIVNHTFINFWMVKVTAKIMKWKEIHFKSLDNFLLVCRV